MVNSDATIRVVLDTSQAKSELRDLVRQSAETSGRASSTLRQRINQGLGVVGLGTGIGAGVAAVRGATESGIGDVIGESLGGLGAQLAQTFLGSLDEDARATRSAREETIQAFGAIAGQTDRIPPGARDFFNQVKSVRLQEERGREIFQRDDDFRGPGVGDLIDRILDGIGELVSQAVDALADRLNPFN